MLLLAWFIILTWLAPSHVIPRGDDFGYLDSVVDTVRAGRWVASDWLEPLNLPLAVTSSILYVATGDFYGSTVGLNLLIAFANLILLRFYLQPAIGSSFATWLIAFGLCLLPPWLNKAVGYTSVSLGIACTLAAWLCWRRAWHGLFFACVLLGFLNRQSALCLLAWPVVGLFRQWQTEKRVHRGVAFGLIITLGIATAVVLSAPSSYAREIARPFERFSMKTFGANLALALVVLTSCNAVWSALSGAALAPIVRANIARPLLPLGCMSASAAIILSGWHGLLWESPEMDTFGLLVFAIGTAGGAWLNRWNTRFPPEVVLFVVGYAVIVSVRGTWWDYYFIEPVLALLGLPRETTALRWARGWRIGALLTGGTVSVILLKSHIVMAENKTVAYERALRAGEVRIVELSDAVFGYLGWKLFAIAQQRPDAVALSDFLKFVEGSRAKYLDGVITVRRDAWRKSIHPTMEGWQLPADYVDRRLPLNNEEWKAFIYGSKK